MTTAIARTGSAGLVRTLEQQREIITATADKATDIDRLFGLVRATMNADSNLREVLDTEEGLISAIHATQKLATLGLEPTGREGGAYLVAFNNNTGTKDRPVWRKLVQVMPDWRTWVRRAVEQGLCDDIIPRPVHVNDEFEIWQDVTTGREVVSHKFKPFPMKARGERIGWVVTILKDGTAPRYECIDMDAIAKRHAVSKGGSIWKQWGDEMELKTVVRMAVGRRLPLGARKLADLFTLDDATTTVEIRNVTPANDPPKLFGAPPAQLPAPAAMETGWDEDDWLTWARDKIGADRAETIFKAVCADNGGDFMFQAYEDAVLEDEAAG